MGKQRWELFQILRSSRNESLSKKYSLHCQCTRISAWTLLVSEMKKPGKFQVGKRKFWGIMSGPAQPLMLTLKGHFFLCFLYTTLYFNYSSITYSLQSRILWLIAQTKTTMHCRAFKHVAVEFSVGSRDGSSHRSFHSFSAGAPLSMFSTLW